MSVALGVDMFDCVYPTRTAVCSFSDNGIDLVEIRKCHHSAWSS